MLLLLQPASGGLGQLAGGEDAEVEDELVVLTGSARSGCLGNNSMGIAIAS
jgi:hypothetical protein